jgi:hypothetical protein
MSKADQRTAQTVVFGLFLLGGYFLWRGRARYEVLDERFDFDKSASTRHMVAMHRRVDRSLLEDWLAAQPPADAPSAPSSEAPAARPQ